MDEIIIQSGYRVSITTWENDADYYMTQVLDGLCAQDAAFYVDLARQFASVNSLKATDGGANLGNNECSLISLVTLLSQVASRHPSMSTELYERVKDLCGVSFLGGGYEVYEFMHTVLGEAVYYDNDFMRAYESHKIQHIKETVRVPVYTISDNDLKNACS